MAKQQEQKIHPVYVIAGQDAFLRVQAMLRLRDQLLGKDQGLGEVRFEGKSADLISILDELRTVPFLSSHRVVVVDEADKFVSENRDRLEEYLGSPSPTGILVLVLDTWRKNTRLAKQVDQIGQVLSAEPMKGQQIAQWVLVQARQWGKDMAPGAVDELVSLVGTETGRLANELEKLVLYVGSRRQIMPEDVSALSGQTSQENVFLITDLMAEGKTAEVIGVLNRILEADRSAEFSLVGVLTFSLRRLLKAKSLLESGLDLEQVRRFGAGRLQQLLGDLTKIDYANKTGLGQARTNLEKFVLCATTNG
jgi:DNA polymerase III subunit delta